MEKQGVIREGVTPRVDTPAPARFVAQIGKMLNIPLPPCEKTAAAHDAAIRELEEEDPVVRIAEDVARNSTL